MSSKDSSSRKKLAIRRTKTDVSDGNGQNNNNNSSKSSKNLGRLGTLRQLVSSRSVPGKGDNDKNNKSNSKSSRYLPGFVQKIQENKANQKRKEELIREIEVLRRQIEDAYRKGFKGLMTAGKESKFNQKVAEVQAIDSSYQPPVITTSTRNNDTKANAIDIPFPFDTARQQVKRILTSDSSNKASYYQWFDDLKNTKTPKEPKDKNSTEWKAWQEQKQWKDWQDAEIKKIESQAKVAAKAKTKELQASEKKTAQENKQKFKFDFNKNYKNRLQSEIRERLLPLFFDRIKELKSLPEAFIGYATQSQQLENYLYFINADNADSKTPIQKLDFYRNFINNPNTGEINVSSSVRHAMQKNIVSSIAQARQNGTLNLTQTQSRTLQEIENAIARREAEDQRGNLVQNLANQNTSNQQTNTTTNTSNKVKDGQTNSVGTMLSAQSGSNVNQQNNDNSLLNNNDTLEESVSLNATPGVATNTTDNAMYALTDYGNIDEDPGYETDNLLSNALFNTRNRSNNTTTNQANNIAYNNGNATNNLNGNATNNLNGNTTGTETEF